MEHVISQFAQEIGGTLVTIQEIAITDPQTKWSDGYVGAYCPNEGALPTEGYVDAITLKFHTGFTHTSITFGYDGSLNKERAKEALMKLIMSF